MRLFNNNLGDIYWKETLRSCEANQAFFKSDLLMKKTSPLQTLTKLGISILWLNFELSNRSSFSNFEMLLHQKMQEKSLN